ncbi:quinone-dependent dihydroorotate dehydrogenase [Patescibacteria group bacterium]|nr:quinone-dependent dihydroorotate dehydrogenase [Patescibacteria group bacterium]MBU1906918.1 quinone-dependent dihydroorotate dehydrogenase [Patescibacteria group bacterium]
MLATKFIRVSYKNILKPILFLIDPEVIHDLFVKIGSTLGGSKMLRNFTARLFYYRHASLRQEILGIQFENPIGLAAGFDKDARMTDILPAVGFGFEEIGSITGEPCAGNTGKRLWRLPGSKALRVYYGLKNEGCEVIATRLATKHFDFPIGVSVAKTNCPATADDEVGISDYAKALETCSNIGDYFTINISCPNAFGGEPFTDKNKLDRLLTKLDAVKTEKPIFLKIAVDLGEPEIDDIIEVCNRHRVQGFVAANLTKKTDHACIAQDEVHPDSKGGISGLPTREPSNKQISYLYKKCGDKYVIIGCGGVFSAEDAYEKIRLGASLVQLITGMIFEGPQLIGEINRGLVALMKRDGYNSISDAIGTAHRQ